MPLSLVFVLFPVVAQLAAVAGGERAMGAPSLALLGVVLGASLLALTTPAAGRSIPTSSGIVRTRRNRAVAGVDLGALPSRV